MKEEAISNALHSLKYASRRTRFAAPMIQRLFDKFLSSSLKSLQTLQEGAQNADLETIRERAHAIRGLALTLEFTRIGALCEQLEQAAQTQAMIDYADVTERLAKHLKILEEHHTEIRDKIPQVIR